jgi:photoactive yellow protein
MLASMEEQLQALYQEKQQLMDLGFDDADDAARRLSELEGQVAVLTDERDALRARLRTAETRRPAARRDDDRRQGRDDDRRASSGPPSDTYAPGPASDDDGPRVAPPETLRRLDTMSDDELDTLPFGVVQTDDQGVVQYASPDGVRLPGFAASPDEARGRNFFFDLAPSANNSLFRGRFQRGVEAGEMDTGFLYTFVGPGRPPAVARVQLYRAPDARTTWILHRPL